MFHEIIYLTWCWIHTVTRLVLKCSFHNQWRNLQCGRTGVICVVWVDGGHDVMIWSYLFEVHLLINNLVFLCYVYLYISKLFCNIEFLAFKIQYIRSLNYCGCLHVGAVYFGYELHINFDEGFKLLMSLVWYRLWILCKLVEILHKIPRTY